MFFFQSYLDQSLRLSYVGVFTAEMPLKAIVAKGFGENSWHYRAAKMGSSLSYFYYLSPGVVRDYMWTF